MNDPRTIDEHEDVRLLLPWYVNETLDAAERSRVERHVERCERCNAELAEHRSIDRFVRDDSPTPIVPAANPAGVLARADKQPRRRSFGAPSAWLLAAGVAAVAVVAAAVVGSRQPSSPNQQFETVTSTQVASDVDYVVEVRLKTAANAASDRALLEGLGGTDITAMVTPRTYRMVVTGQSASLESIASYTAGLEKRPDIDDADVVALQLPVE